MKQRLPQNLPHVVATPTFDPFTRSLLAEGLGDLSPGKPANGDFQVVDLFCGRGGLSVGFEFFARRQRSYRLAGAVDINPKAIATYAANLPVEPLCRDLAKVSESTRSMERLRDDLKIDESKPLIVIGGPPCQGFSAHRKKDERQDDLRNSLVVAFAKIAAFLNPEFILFENVPEVLSDKHWSLFLKVKGRLERAGYRTRAQVHNLASFGLPQERFRTLIVAAKQPFHMPLPLLPQERYRTVRDAIGFLPPIRPGERPGDPMHFCANHKETTIRVIQAVPKNGGSRPAGIGPRCLQKVDGFRDVYGRMFWDRPANTITANSRNPAGGRYVHPQQNRGMTVREAALIQGFPASFQFAGSFDEKFVQIGNAVSPLVAAILANCLWNNIKNPPKPIPKSELLNDVTEPISNSFSSGIAGRKRRAKIAAAA